MIKLLKNMRLPEVLMAALCAALVVAQVYFDLLLPDCMTELTALIQTAGTQTSQIVSVGLKMLAYALASAALAITCGYLSARVASGFSYAVREKLFGHVMALDAAGMQAFSVPALITRTTNDITQIQMIVSMGLQMLIKAPVMAVWAIIKILGKSYELSAVTAGFVIAVSVSVFLIMSSCLPRFRLVQRMTDKINRVARENLTGINVVHAFNAEEYQNEKFDEPSSEMLRLQIKNQRLFALINPILSLAMNGLTLVVFWLGAALVEGISGIPERVALFSEIVAFSTYATYIVMSFMMLVMIFMMLPQAQVSAERINEVLAAKSAIVEGSRTEGTEKGSVEFRGVSFAYPGSAEPELTDVSFRVSKGETLAVIGATGSGKTTLVSLIPRLFDVSCGEVLVDGVNVKEYKSSALYDKIGFVTQRATLFSGTITENVAFGEGARDFSEEAVSEALSVSQASEFVDKLPDGAEYKLAQLGRNVSGGQKQRISIARALARRPEILIFDDSFSALDYRTDSRLRAELDKSFRGVTKIIVAQRIGTIRHADNILVLDRGELVGAGTHEELMQSCSVYREIASSQLDAEELA